MGRYGGVRRGAVGRPDVLGSRGAARRGTGTGAGPGAGPGGVGPGACPGGASPGAGPDEAGTGAGPGGAPPGDGARSPRPRRGRGREQVLVEERGLPAGRTRAVGARTFAYAGTSLTTRAWAPTTAWSATVTGPSTVAPVPRTTPSPTRGACAPRGAPYVGPPADGAEGHLVVDRHVGTDLRGLADDHGRTVVDEDPAAQFGAGVDLDPGGAPGGAGEQTGRQTPAATVQPVRDAVRPQGGQRRVQQRFAAVADGRVTLDDHTEVLAHRAQEARLFSFRHEGSVVVAGARAGRWARAGRCAGGSVRGRVGARADRCADASVRGRRLRRARRPAAAPRRRPRRAGRRAPRRRPDR